MTELFIRSEEHTTERKSLADHVCQVEISKNNKNKRKDHKVEQKNKQNKQAENKEWSKDLKRTNGEKNM